MIEKIIAIRSLGRFVGYAASGDVTFGRVTLIYGENGRGKSTLSAILRSLATNNPQLINERRTLGQTDQPLVELRVDGSNTTFSDDGWTSNYPQLCIFDPQFIFENVYSGPCVDHEHKKQHYRFVVGERGRDLALKVADLDAQIRDINPQIRSKAADLREHISGDASIDDFLELPAVRDVDEAIAQQRKNVEALEKAQDIREKHLLSPLSIPVIPIDEIEALLSKQVAGIAEDAARMTMDHIASCMDDNGETWVRTGLSYVRDSKCPFCAQSLQDVALLGAYKGFFAEAYDAFRGDIESYLRDKKTALSEANLARLEGIVNSNGLLADFWKVYVDVELPQIDLDQLIRKWRNVRSALLSQLSDKLRSPLERIPLNPELEDASQAYAVVVEAATACSSSIESINLDIDRKKEEAAAGDVQAGTNELLRLSNSKTRHTNGVALKCTEYELLLATKEGLELEKQQTKDELDSYTEAVFSRYQTQINQYLACFGTEFRICNVLTSYVGGSPSSTYQIEINNTPVDLGDATTPPGTPCFKNTLSSGDKSALAFAFFLARLDQDESLCDKTIVLDDPHSSLDAHRRTCTQQQITRLCQRARQVIVMSHDPYFLWMLWDSCDRATTKTLQISRGRDQSEIRRWDIERETQGQYVQKCRLLVDYVKHGSAGSLRDVALCIRPVLEGHLRVKFPDEFGGAESLGDMLRKIALASSPDPLHAMSPLLEELWEINNYSKRYHHDQNPRVSSELINDPELRAFVRRTLDLLRSPSFSPT